MAELARPLNPNLTGAAMSYACVPGGQPQTKPVPEHASPWADGFKATLAEGINQSHISQWHSAERGSHISVLARTYLSTAYPKTVGSLRQRAQNTQQAQNATTSTDGCNATLKTSTLQKHCLQSACKVRSNPNGMATGSLLTQNPAAWNSSSTVPIHM